MQKRWFGCKEFLNKVQKEKQPLDFHKISQKARDVIFSRNIYLTIQLFS